MNKTLGFGTKDTFLHLHSAVYGRVPILLFLCMFPLQAGALFFLPTQIFILDTFGLFVL